MEVNEIKERLCQLRLTEMEARDAIVEQLRAVQEKRGWKELGFRSLAECCHHLLGYEPQETREISVRLGVSLPATKLVSEDPVVQVRIEKLKSWRRTTAFSLGVPAFRVLTNRALMNAATENPQDAETLKRVHGIGERKVEAFGREILGALSI